MFLNDCKVAKQFEPRSSTLFLWLIFAGMFVLTVSIAVTLGQKRQSLDSKTEAEKVWEMAIKAKGGRERLSKIENIQISSTKDSRNISVKESQATLGKRYVARHESLNVLPDKVWVYADESKSVFGITQSMLNFDNKLTYFGGEKTDVETLDTNSPGMKNYKGYQNPQILYLMESRWLKPEIIGMRSGNADGADVQIVETRFDGRRVDFALDPKTLLPAQIKFYDTGFDGGLRLRTARMWNYIEVDGIKVPQRMSYSDTISRGGTEEMTIRFNVEYDPNIFLKPPAKLTPDAWTKKSIKL